jgi:hypothetical protein
VVRGRDAVTWGCRCEQDGIGERDRTRPRVVMASAERRGPTGDLQVQGDDMDRTLKERVDDVPDPLDRDAADPLRDVPALPRGLPSPQPRPPSRRIARTCELAGPAARKAISAYASSRVKGPSGCVQLLAPRGAQPRGADGRRHRRTRPPALPQRPQPGRPAPDEARSDPPRRQVTLLTFPPVVDCRGDRDLATFRDPHALAHAHENDRAKLCSEPVTGGC